MKGDILVFPHLPELSLELRKRHILLNQILTPLYLTCMLLWLQHAATEVIYLRSLCNIQIQESPFSRMTRCRCHIKEFEAISWLKRRESVLTLVEEGNQRLLCRGSQTVYYLEFEDHSEARHHLPPESI